MAGPSMLCVSNYLNRKIIYHSLLGQNFSYSAGWIALYKSNPTPYNTGIEVTGGGYQRKLASYSSPTSGCVTNSVEVEFAEATADWGEITHIGIKNTSGSLLYYGALEYPTYIGMGDVFNIPAGGLIVELKTGYSDYYANNMLNHTLKNTTFTSSGSSVYLALFTSVPEEDGTGGVEVSATGYARVKTSGSDMWQVGNAPVYHTYNKQPIIFTNYAPVDWGTVRGIGIYDHSTSGNLIFRGTFNKPITVEEADSLKFNTYSLYFETYYYMP